MGNGMWGMQGRQGMFTKIPGNLLEDSREYFHFTIPRNSRKDFEEIPRNVREDSGECSRRFWGMFQEILGDVIKDSGKCY